MDAAANFIKNNFKQAAVLKQGAGGLTELVTGAANTVYIRKTVNGTGLAYSLLAQIKCLSLPQVFYTGEADGKTYVIEEYISGASLAQQREQRAFTEKEVRLIALQLCDALTALHGHGILHRDIKPGNIISQGGRVWLVDFGAAKITGSGREQDTRILGTPGYAPPEQYGFSVTDVCSDIYALGKTMEALLPPAYNGHLRKIINRCTQFDPQNRISSAAELKKQLQSTGVNKKLLALLPMLIAAAAYWYYTPTQPQAVPPLQSGTQMQSAAQQAPPQADVNTEQQFKQSNVPAARADNDGAAAIEDVKITDNNLQFSINTNPLHQTAKDKGAQHGLTLLAPQQNKIPGITVHNNSGAALQNPKLIINFRNFCITGNNLSAAAWGGRQLDWQLAKNSGGFAQSMQISLTGTIPAGDYFEFTFAGAAADYYTNGSGAQATITLAADNLQPITQTCTIKIN